MYIHIYIKTAFEPSGVGLALIVSEFSSEQQESGNTKVKNTLTVDYDWLRASLAASPSPCKPSCELARRAQSTTDVA